jgi:hypothetical protein
MHAYALHNLSGISLSHVRKFIHLNASDALNLSCLQCMMKLREFFQCDFDVAGSYASMVADAEVLKVRAL